ncbi:hypothetical protein [Deinococcus fonticola]|uniref:hypothetical protein n=1 Tax=Deinococcus fonticola TaxID=2528713 RepID=UPI0010756BE8|nr:hypothetical protein [Deinococcus fonticola]
MSGSSRSFALPWARRRAVYQGQAGHIDADSFELLNVTGPTPPLFEVIPGVPAESMVVDAQGRVKPRRFGPGAQGVGERLIHLVFGVLLGNPLVVGLTLLALYGVFRSVAAILELETPHDGVWFTASVFVAALLARWAYRQYLLGGMERFVQAARTTPELTLQLGLTRQPAQQAYRLEVRRTDHPLKVEKILERHGEVWVTFRDLSAEERAEIASAIGQRKLKEHL